MAVIVNTKMFSFILQMVLLVQYHQVAGIKIKRTPYSVQEMNQEYSSGSDIGSYTPWSETYSSSDSGGGNYFGGQFSGSSGGFYSPHLSSLSSFGIQDSSSGSYDSFGSYGKHISDDSQFLSSGGKSINDLQEEAKTKLNNLILESKQNQILAEAKIEKMRKSYGYGTFGYGGYQYPISTGPIDLGTHHAIDLGTTLDSKSIKDSKGKLKYPVQTVYITKTVGVPIPEPYPIKHEVPVPAPYPVPVPSNHYSSQSYPSSFSSDYSTGSGKTSHHNSGLSVNKVIRYHENLPKSTEKHYGSASTNYVRYLPSRASSPTSSSSAYRTALNPSHYSSHPKQSVYEF